MTSRHKFAITIRWIARITGSLILAFVLFFILAHLFGEEESDAGFRNTKEVITFIFFPVSLVVGLGLALKWEGLGGFIVLLGMTGLFMLRPDLLGAGFMIPLIPAGLYIAYWFLSRNKWQPTNS
jgi:hypothetical protein